LEVARNLESIIGKRKGARRLPPVTPLRTQAPAALPPAATQAPKAEGRFKRTNWLIGTAVAAIGLVAAYFAIWEVWLRTVPIVESPEITDQFDILPFTVRNQSPFFTIYSASLKCDTTSYGLRLPKSNKRHYMQAIAVTKQFDIHPDRDAKLTCSVVYLVDGPNETLEGQINKIKMATMAISAEYKTKFLWWTIDRQSEPAYYAWDVTAAGHHYWTPYDPKSIPLDKYYAQVE
jgi:hypothetical protein